MYKDICMSGNICMGIYVCMYVFMYMYLCMYKCMYVTHFVSLLQPGNCSESSFDQESGPESIQRLFFDDERCQVQVHSGTFSHHGCLLQLGSQYWRAPVPISFQSLPLPLAHTVCVMNVCTVCMYLCMNACRMYFVHSVLANYIWSSVNSAYLCIRMFFFIYSIPYSSRNKMGYFMYVCTVHLCMYMVCMYVCMYVWRYGIIIYVVTLILLKSSWWEISSTFVFICTCM